MAEHIRCVPAKPKQVAMQVIPKHVAATRHETARQFQCQWPMTGTGYVFAQLLLVGREYADATPPARDGHIPLLRIRRRLDCGIRKENVIHRLALRAVGRDRVAGQELAEAFVQYAAICQFDAAIWLNGLTVTSSPFVTRPPDWSLRLALRCKRSPDARFTSRV